jgi:phosphate starvation-inducible PhoH-like protein
LIKQKSKPGTKVTEDKATPQKQRIRELIKKPKEKFLTKSQEEYWKVLGENQITICIGPSGTGKSYVTLKKAIDLLWEEDNKYEKIVLARPPVVAGTEIGHLPGDLNAKLDPYIIPSYYLLNKIIGKEELEKLKDLGIVEILSISHLRGYNIDNAILIVEEGQNTTPVEMKLILTRIGFNSKFFITGDIEQTDKFRDKTKSGLYDAKRRLESMKEVAIFEFGSKDIVRNPIIGQILERYSDV